MGPAGQGPRTGRGLGYCSGNTAPGSATAGRQGGGGRGRGRGGRGRGQGGRGNRNQFLATGQTGWQRAEAEAEPVPESLPPEVSEPEQPTERNQVAELRQQAAELAGSLQEIQKRITDLEVNEQGADQ